MCYSEKIAVIVVTYNRKKWLCECLDSIISQSVRVDKIYVIDNNSNDGTEAYLELNGYLNNKAIKYRNLYENTGGSGGFYCGVKAAYEDGCKWLWLMDDDVEAYPDALEKLLEYKKISKCIHGKRRGPNNELVPWTHYFDKSSVKLKPMSESDINRDKNYVVMNVGCFEGMLIHRDIIKDIGFPDKEYFITWDDTVYGFLASHFTDVICANVYSLKRKRPLDRVIGLFGKQYVFLSPMASYYYQRNRFLVAKKLNISGYYFWRESFYSVVKILIKDGIINRDLSRLFSSLKGAAAGFKLYYFK